MMYIRKGEFIVGTQDEPFQGSAAINLYGNKSQSEEYFDIKMFESGNKVIANTGKLQMYGQQIGLQYSRLGDSAQPGQDFIEVVDVLGKWNFGRVKEIWLNCLSLE
jgi:hypothetical protein